MKFLVFIILIIVSVVWKYRQGRQLDMDKISERKFDVITYKKDIFQYEKNINKHCSNNDCYLSSFMVNNIVNIIEEKGFVDTVKTMRDNREKYLTDSGEYIFINGKNAEGDVVFLYHNYLNLDSKNMVDSQKALNEGVCNIDVCNIEELISGLIEFADKHGEGFYVYNWYSPVNKEIIKKRTYVKKVDNVKTQFGKQSIYIGSGSTIVDDRKKVFIKTVLVYAVNALLFIFLWFILRVDNLMRASFLSDVIFYLIMSVFMFNIWMYHRSVEQIRSIEERYSDTTQVSIATAGIGLAMSLFFYKLLTIKEKETSNQSTRLLSVSIMLSLLSFVEIKLSKTEENLHIKTVLKQSLHLSSIGFLLITLLFVYLNVK